MNEINAKNDKKSLSTTTIAQYVHDMADLERKEFTLRKTVEAYYKKATQNENDAEIKVISATQQHEKLLSSQKNIEQTAGKKGINFPTHMEPPKYIESPKYLSENQYTYSTLSKIMSVIGIFITVTFVIAMLWMLVGNIIMPDDMGNIIAIISEKHGIGLLVEDLGLLLGIPFGILFAIILYVGVIKQKENTYRQYLSKRKEAEDYQEKKYAYSLYEQMQDTITQIKQSEKSIDEAKYEKNIVLLQSNIVKKEALALSQKADLIQKQKEKLYALNIIPPDYRTFDCALELDHIFRNDLADTMRQAILIYDERVFRGEIIKGIENIYNMLGNLAATMSNIESVLRDIKSDVHTMSNDVFNISHNMEILARTQEKMLDETIDANRAAANKQQELIAETRATRYAANAVQESNRKYEWYMDQHIKGYL